MGAYEGLSRYFPEGIVNKAHKLGYGEVFISLLNGDEETVVQKYNSIWNTLKQSHYQREGRTPMEFGRDLTASWLFEDCVLGVLKVNGVNVSYGQDYINRKVFTSRVDKLDTNVTIYVGGKSHSLQIRCDHKLAWSKTNIMYLTESKFKKMKKRNALMLGFSTVDGKMIVMDNSCTKNATYIESYEPYGGRPVWAINISDYAISDFTFLNAAESIKNYCLYK